MGFAVAKYLLDKLYKQNLWGLGLNLELLILTENQKGSNFIIEMGRRLTLICADKK